MNPRITPTTNPPKPKNKCYFTPKKKKSFKATTVWVRDGLRQRHLGGVIMLTLIFITIDLSLRLSVSGWAWIRVELNQLGNTILVVWSGAGATSSRWWSDGLASLLALSLSLSLSLRVCESKKAFEGKWDVNDFLGQEAYFTVKLYYFRLYFTYAPKHAFGLGVKYYPNSIYTQNKHNLNGTFKAL